MQPYKISTKNELFSGLNFSLSDINLDNSGLNLVPISLDIISNQVDDVKEVPPPPNLSNIVSHDRDSGIHNSSGIHSRYVLNPEAHVSKIEKVANVEVPRESIIEYQHVTPHWFFHEAGRIWKPFSVCDSDKLECKYIELCSVGHCVGLDDCVPVDGGRYDVRVIDRVRVPVYWNEEHVNVRRVTWLFREEDGCSQVPYTESECDSLEAKYREVVNDGRWHQWVQVAGISGVDDGMIDDQFVFHSSHTMAEYRRYIGDENVRARVVYRGVSSLSHVIEQGHSGGVNHVALVVHGIGPICDYRGHDLVHCVSEMRYTSNIMMAQHMKGNGNIGVVEYLPVCWNKSLHVTIDEQLSRVTLASVPKLRVFTNGALVDVLCYSSPTYCHTILTSVATEMNRLRHLFMSRNPHYDGTFSIIGHSLGAVIAMDLVSLQDPDSDLHIPLDDSAIVPHLEFELGHLFAIGSPMALFLTARGLPFLGPDFQLTACKGVYNIYHPFDPVAYRMEPMLVTPCPSRAVQVPHHKGRKRLHLELKDNLVKVGSDLKSRLLQTLRITWSSLQDFASAHKPDSGDGDEWHNDDDEDVLRALAKIDDSGIIDTKDKEERNTPPVMDEDTIGAKLNGGKRVDYVLQEAPLESFNDYLFALGSHACYWTSEDTVLKIINEVYTDLGISTNASTNVELNPQPCHLNHQSYTSPIHTGRNMPPLPPAYNAMLPPSMPPPIQTYSTAIPPPMPSSSVRTKTRDTAPHAQKTLPHILPPALPVIQAISFFQPSSTEPDEPQSGGLGVEESTVNYTDATKSHYLPPMSYYNRESSSMITPSTVYYPPFMSGTTESSSMQYFQPQFTSDNVQVSETETYFSDNTSYTTPDLLPSTNDPMSLASIYYQKFDSANKQTPLWMPDKDGSDLYTSQETYTWNSSNNNMTTCSTDYNQAQHLGNIGTSVSGGMQQVYMGDMTYQSLAGMEQDTAYLGSEVCVAGSAGETNMVGAIETKIDSWEDVCVGSGEDNVSSTRSENIAAMIEVYRPSRVTEQGPSDSGTIEYLGSEGSVTSEAHADNRFKDCSFMFGGGREDTSNKLAGETCTTSAVRPGVSLASEPPCRDRVQPGRSSEDIVDIPSTDYVRTSTECDSVSSSRRGSSTMHSHSPHPPAQWTNNSRTPSPQSIGQSTRAPAKNVIAGSNVFGSRPLVPQSGKLFNKRKQ